MRWVQRAGTNGLVELLGFGIGQSVQLCLEKTATRLVLAQRSCVLAGSSLKGETINQTFKPSASRLGNHNRCCCHFGGIRSSAASEHCVGPACWTIRTVACMCR